MIRVTTEHDGTREYPDNHRVVITEIGVLHVEDGEGYPVISLADGQWRSVEHVADPPAAPEGSTTPIYEGKQP